MLIFDDEITDLPGFRTHPRYGTPGRIVLWQHHWSVAELTDYARLHLPLLQLPDVSRLCHKRQRERLSVAILLGRLIGQDVRLAHAPSGRPYIIGGGAEVSVTHTGNLYGVSLGQQRHGIDAEQWGEKALRLSQRFLQPAELPLLDRLPMTRTEAATVLWSAKEAVYKALDRPGLLLIPDISLSLGPVPSQLIANVRGENGAEWAVRLHRYPGCVLTVCHRMETFSTLLE